jgi:acetylornithine deacetylase/succinyl-diaminopimelate desuccinylase-like protein
MHTDQTLLAEFIAIPSIYGNDSDNQQAIEFVTTFLKEMGFTVRIRGQSRSTQATVIAHLKPEQATRKIVIYGHYDVAPVSTDSVWKSQNPFKLEQINQRLYGRGVADNKGSLLMRLLAIKELIENKQAMPEILWLIQGEEEITSGERIAKEIFKNELTDFDAQVFIEETGFNDIETQEQIAFLWSPSIKQNKLNPWHLLLNEALSNPKIEYRHLNKLNGTQDCPFLSNLPENAVYMGFGPNDRLHNIHRDNESLDSQKLANHKKQFKQFLSLFTKKHPHA